MPLGVCVRCERAYIFGARNDARDPACPRCGKGLRSTSVSRVVEQPTVPLSIPELSDPQILAKRDSRRAA